MFTKSLDTILAGFNKTIQALDDLQDVNTHKITVNHQKINVMETQNNLLVEERDQAVVVANRLRDLVA